MCHTSRILYEAKSESLYFWWMLVKFLYFIQMGYYINLHALTCTDHYLIFLHKFYNKINYYKLLFRARRTEY
jgi:hypothetical protein